MRVVWQLAPLKGRRSPWSLVHKVRFSGRRDGPAWGYDRTWCGRTLPTTGQLMDYHEGDSHALRMYDHCYRCFPDMKEGV